ncbi:dihydrodipicolinate synthase family protein [Niabella sp. CC-SYL272]|uniref:dihydrodipicolinate synthase family protein n=1 Tax=Niabella agricola TaxID=2891571 RepID=UPI001F361B2F|nr:dihydrodipicolinate synthase family protein [Niabella agricola]MCF3109649.1 dihydrodipicolinate synthase family protein [Niabella agricola]
MKIKGIIAATFSTLKEDGSLDLDKVPLLVEQLITDGVQGIFICGTNGEGPNLTEEERMQIAEAYVKAVDKRILVFVHVGHNAIAVSRRLAKHAGDIGADAISSVAGFYFKPASVNNLVDCMAAIAEAAPGLPFYYYHIPAITGISVDMIRFLELAEERIPSFAGIKYTAATLQEYQSCLNYKNGKYDILFGYDELLLPALSVGAKGAIGSTYTFAAPLYNAVIRAFEQGDLEKARGLQWQAVQMISCLAEFGPIPTQKAIVSLKGLDLGPCRLPLMALDADQKKHVKQFLESIHFFENLDRIQQKDELTGNEK